MIGLFSANVELLLSSGSRHLTMARVARSDLTAVLNPRNTRTPHLAFTRLVCGAAIQLNSRDLCHRIISLHYYSFFRAFERCFLVVNQKIFILFTFNAIMQIVKSKLHSFQI